MVCSCANVQCEHIASAGLLQRALVLTMSPPRRPYRSESRSTVKTSEEERWHMRKAIHLMIAAAVAGLAAACGEGTAPASGQADVLAAEADQLGAMVDTDFGAAGAAATAAPTTSSSGVLAAPTATAGDTAPTFWGRLRVVPGGPRPVYHRDVTMQGDTARVEHDVTFQGVFLVDTSADGLFNPTAKPLADRMTQRAVLVRHADRLGTSWPRIPMTDNGDGTYQRSWIARRTGIDRFVVDALDSATLLLGTGDNYRTNEVGIPYRIE